MIKSDYKVNDAVTVIKPGMFKDLTGKVLSNNTDTSFMPLTVILDNNLGTWSYRYVDVQPLGKEKAVKIEAIPFEKAEKKDSIDNLTVATKPAKRPYNKRPKDEPKKEKRKYTRKIKS